MTGTDVLALQQEVKTLRARLAELEQSGRKTPSDSESGQGNPAQKEAGSRGAGPVGWQGVGHSLSKEQVERYSRQLILPSFGVAGVISVQVTEGLSRVTEGLSKVTEGLSRVSDGA